MNSDNEHWASISDMMSGLMIIFLFISVAYMNSVTKSKIALEAAKVQAETARQKVESIAQAWDKVQVRLYNDLYTEFNQNILLQQNNKEWQAHIDRSTLSIRFEAPTTFFNQGKFGLPDTFKRTLNDFFPRYLKILARYKDHIAEVRIEGHTSSEWRNGTDRLEAYFNNMRLSQDRAREVLQHCLKIPAISGYLDWAMQKITANGMSSSHPVKNRKNEEEEDPDLSRRVEFRVRIDSDSSIKKILEDSK